MHLDSRAFQRADTVLQGNARMGICTGVKHHAVVGESHLLQLVDKLTLDVTLIVVNLNVGILGTQLGKISLKRTATIDSWFPHPKQIEVGTIDYLYFLYYFKFLFSYLK